MTWKPVSYLYEFKGHKLYYKALVEPQSKVVWSYFVVSGVTKDLPPSMLPKEYRAMHRGTAATLEEAQQRVEEYVEKHNGE